MNCVLKIKAHLNDKTKNGCPNFIYPIYYFCIRQPANLFHDYGFDSYLHSIEYIYQVTRFKKFGINCEGAIVEYVTNKYGDRTPIIKFNTSKGIEISGKPFGTYSGVIGPFRFSNDPTTEKLAIRYNSKTLSNLFTRVKKISTIFYF